MLRPLKNLSGKGKFFAGAAILSVCGGGIALAQNVEGLDIQQIIGRGEAADADAEALIREVSRRGDEMRAEAKDAADAGNRNLAENKGVLGGGPTGPIDFDQMLAASTDLEASDKAAPQLIVFASLSMPEQSLKKLIRDTAKAGGTVVFNGFPGNSMKAFQQGIMKVVDNQDAYGSIGIDPRLFRAFDVTAVPAIVVVTSDFELCDGFDCRTTVPPFDRMTGNVPLEYALETFVDGRGPGSAIAGQALSRLKRGQGS